jgi:DNA polymerase I-like protein with 3'-5' exonuclease and polymerase domains
MSDLDDALAALERAVSRLEAAPARPDGDAPARLAAERDAENQQIEATAADIVARVEAALAKISQVLGEEG